MQNLTKEEKFFKYFIGDKSMWIPTQKIDGTSITYYMTEDYKFGVCSRNLENTDENSTPWKVAEKLGLKEIMTEWVDLHRHSLILQGELFGESIQKNPIGIKGQNWLCFNVSYYDNYTKQTYLVPYLNAISDEILSKVEFVPNLGLILPGTIELMLNQADSIKNQVNGGNKDAQIEGIVWKHKLLDKIIIDGKEYKPSFKVISNKYLLKYE